MKTPHNLKGCRCPKGSDIRFCLGNPTPQPTTVQNKPQLSAEMEKKLEKWWDTVIEVEPSDIKSKTICIVTDADVSSLIATAQEEERNKVIEEFAEYCHEHYLGCAGNKNSKTGYSYEYDSEVVCLIEPFLNQLKGEK